MRFKFTLFMFFISLFLCTRVMADNRKVYYGFLEFEVIDESAKTVSVTGYRGSTTVLTIPSIFKDDDNSIEYKVVEISSLAFSFSKISKIELPNTLLKIGTAAFEESSLTSIIIPNSVISIGDFSFSKCHSLSSVTFGSGLTTIGERAFAESGLTTVMIPSNVRSLEQYAFMDCKELTSVEINCAKVGNGVFSGCENISSIIIGDNVNSIESFVFDTDKVTNLVIGNGITKISIGSLGIYNWKKLETLKIDVASIEESAFSFCESLKSLEIGNHVISIGNSAFYNCRSLTALEIPDNVKTIGENAFYGCSYMATLRIGKSVSSIGVGAFDGIPSKVVVVVGWDNPLAVSINVFGNSFIQSSIGDATLYVPKGTIGLYKTSNFWKDFGHIIEGNGPSADDMMKPFEQDGITYQVLNLEENTVTITGAVQWLRGDVEIPAEVIHCGEYFSVTSIANEAFASHQMVKTLKLPASITTIGEMSFRGCADLTTLEIQSGTIGSFAFGSLWSLNSVVLGDGVTRIGELAFADAKNLENLTFGNNIEEIGEGAFIECEKLSSIDLPENIKVIGAMAFALSINPNSLTSVIVHWDTPLKNLQSSSFLNNMNATLYVPAGTKSAYERANVWKDFKTIVEYGSTDIKGHKMVTNKMAIYDLQGHKMESDFEHLPYGIYIVDGKKVVIK